MLRRPATLRLALALACTACVTAPVEDEWLVFSSGRSGEGDIYATRVGSDSLRLVVGSPASEGTARYDPQADRIVHSRFDSAGVMLVAGDIELFADPNGDVAPVWSTTDRVAFVAESDGAADLYIADRDGTGRERLTSDDLVERYPAWHPDGRRLVYAKRLDSGWDLHVMDVETREVVRLTFDGIYVGHPAWSPTGDRVAFDRMFGDQAEIAVLDIASGEILQLTSNEENDLLPSWSADGSLLAFAGVRDGNWDVWTVSVDGGEVRRITTDPGFDGGPVYVPGSALR